jgi:hypothetical protein
MDLFIDDFLYNLLGAPVIVSSATFPIPSMSLQ